MAVLALLLMAGGFVAAALPLVWPGSRGGLPVSAAPPDTGAADRDAAYAAIKDLEFEYQLGNLSDEDYRQLREEYVERAARALRRLERSAEREGRTW